MPAKSPAQKRLMDAAAHNPAFAKKVGIPSKVAKEYSTESKGMTFRKGGEMKKRQMSDMGGAAAPAIRRNALARTLAAAKAAAPAIAPAAAGMGMPGMKKGGGVKASSMGKVVSGGMKGHGEHTVQKKGITKGKQVKMSKGGKC